MSSKGSTRLCTDKLVKQQWRGACGENPDPVLDEDEKKHGCTRSSAAMARDRQTRGVGVVEGQRDGNYMEVVTCV
jgi:hypothetical protein